MSIYRMRTEFGKHLKFVLAIIAGIFLVGAVFSFGVAPTSNRQSAGSKEVVAVINGADLTRADYQAQLDGMEEQAREMGIRSPLQYADMRMYIFQQLVSTQSILQIATDMGVDVSDRKVNDEIDKQVTKYLESKREQLLGRRKSYKAEDPRDDSEFGAALKSVGSSISQTEEFVRSKVPANSIRASLAQEGIQKMIQAKTHHVTKKDIEDSYKVYNLRQIVLMKGTKDQLMSKADKIVREAKSGTDFVTLVKGNTDLANDKAQGGVMTYNFQMSSYAPPQLNDAIKKLKPGGVSNPIQLGSAVYVVKLDSVSSEKPAKLDKKAIADRRKQIQQAREMTESMKLRDKMSKMQNVQVRDPEVLAYWQLIQGQQGGPGAYQKSLPMAAAALKRAIKDNNRNYVALTKLAQIDSQLGKTEDAINILYPILDGTNAAIEGADCRILLGDLYLKQNQKDKALNEYKIAGEVARNDKNIHEQLKTKYQQLGKTDLVAAEDKWISDFDKMQAKQGPKGAGNTAPAPKSSSPKAGG